MARGYSSARGRKNATVAVKRCRPYMPVKPGRLLGCGIQGCVYLLRTKGEARTPDSQIKHVIKISASGHRDDDFRAAQFALRVRARAGLSAPHPALPHIQAITNQLGAQSGCLRQGHGGPKQASAVVMERLYKLPWTKHQLRHALRLIEKLEDALDEHETLGHWVRYHQARINALTGPEKYLFHQILSLQKWLIPRNAYIVDLHFKNLGWRPAKRGRGGQIVAQDIGFLTRKDSREKTRMWDIPRAIRRWTVPLAGYDPGP